LGLQAKAARTRWRAACGRLGIVAGASVFGATLVLPLDDPVFVVARMLALIAIH
jgi:hypothetical protein